MLIRTGTLTIAAILLLDGGLVRSLQATIYDANSSFVADLNSAIPSPAFGAYQAGTITSVTDNVPVSSTFNAYSPTDYATGIGGVSGLNGFAVGGNSLPVVTANTTMSSLDISGISGNKPVIVGEMLLHPDNGTGDAALRFTAPAPGAYTITGYFESLATTSDGAYVNVLVNGVSVLSHLLPAGGGGSVNFSSLPSFALATGGTIDFTLGKNVDYGADSTGLFASISVPEPASLVLLAFGAMGLIGRRRI